MAPHTDFDLGWMSGNFDGEGTVVQPRGHGHPALVLSSTDEWIIDRWVSLTGGSKTGPYNHAGKKPWWRWRLGGPAAKELWTDMFAFLCPRRQEQGMVFFTHTPQKVGRKPKTTIDLCSECDSPAMAKGLCSMHYQRMRQWGDAGTVRGVQRPQNYRER